MVISCKCEEIDKGVNILDRVIVSGEKGDGGQLIYKYIIYLALCLCFLCFCLLSYYLPMSCSMTTLSYIHLRLKKCYLFRRHFRISSHKRGATPSWACRSHITKAWWHKIWSLGLSEEYKFQSDEFSKWLTHFIQMQCLYNNKTVYLRGIVCSFTFNLINDLILE